MMEIKPKNSGPMADWANECTEEITPLRTTKVPDNDQAVGQDDQEHIPHLEHIPLFLDHD